MSKKTSIYTIPAGFSFVDELAREILAKSRDDPLSLARIQILLPTRRACRSLHEAFLRLSEGKPFLLPQINPIGEVDEEELSLKFAGMDQELSLPPSITPLRRQFLLSKLIGSMEGRSNGIEQDMLLASALGKLMDQIYTEDLDLNDLPKAVDRAAFSMHWQISLDFLEILSKHWPKILKEEGVIDAADRRNRLLKNLSIHWSKSPPPYPVIAAGSTGSIPATALLLKTIANLPNGYVVLPGLDQIMDEESWNALDNTHPQATLQHLLSKLDIQRNDVKLWPVCNNETKHQKSIRSLISEIFRPAETTQEWRTIKDRLCIKQSDLRIERYDCANPQEEALIIALALRGILEKPKKSAALVTPDRKLARRVAMACRRWGIEVDDSGGQNLSDTKTGIYMRLCMDAVCSGMKPVALLDFCKQALCQPDSFEDWHKNIQNLDLHVMRGRAFEGGINAYRKKFSELEKKNINISLLEETLNFIERGFKPLLAIDNNARFEQWLDAHIQVIEFFCGPEKLWFGQEGESAAALLAELQAQVSIFPKMTAQEYLTVLLQAMNGIAIRPAHGLHPRLMILGQLEARLVETDMVVLSGLNEGTWPQEAGIDPWMSRPMRKRFGLPPLERSIGLSAHDFAQCLCAKEVYLTRSLRVDGTPTVPSRWLQRMDTVLEACGLSANALQGINLLNHALHIDRPDKYLPIERPAPTPPVSSRPRKLSVTQVETWINDPYSIYAQHILKLKPLYPLEQPLDAALRGTLVHSLLDEFVKMYPDKLQSDAEKIFMAIARKELDALEVESDIKSFWEPRLSKIAEWLIDQEQEWRLAMKPAAREVKGMITFQGPAGTFILSARADRIDFMRDGSSAAIIDYKSGGIFSLTGMKDGRHPQLPLEALILHEGGFENVKASPVSNIAYWVLNGAGEGGTIKAMNKASDLTAAQENARQGLLDLIAAFDSEKTPYYSLPRPERAPRFNDYEHLARVREWTTLDEQEDTA